MKLQSAIIFLAGCFAINTLQKALEKQPNIQLTRIFIVGILMASYVQAFLIIDSLILYYLQHK